MSRKQAKNGTDDTVRKDCGQKRPRCTTEQFIEKSRLVHGDTYDYSKVVYIKSNSKVTIKCPEHGDFEQTPNCNLNGTGCRYCASRSRSYDTAKFIKNACFVHGDKFDYSKVVYIKSNIKVIITCRKCNCDFEQKPNSHLNGTGCRLCAIGDMSSDTEKFIEKARLLHGDKYDYRKVEYINSHSHVTIICKYQDHGEFIESPGNHIYSKKICPKCRQLLLSAKFIRKAKKIHGDKYNYEKVQYLNERTSIVITCIDHGDYIQKPKNHLLGKGCSKCHCNYSKGQIQWLDFVASFHSIRIQHAANDAEFLIPETRYRADGYCAETNTIYEYHGDYWHGNPKKFNKDEINKSSKKTFGELYEQTLKRENEIRTLGYNVVVMWESDWLRLNRCVRKLQQKCKSNK